MADRQTGPPTPQTQPQLETKDDSAREIAVHCIPLQEWELCKIEMVLMIRITCNATYVACLLLLCQGSKWLNGKSV